ncbi:MAG: hypothetical protein ACK41T_07530 [Pseudobdellovibrio sp.]
MDKVTVVTQNAIQPVAFVATNVVNDNTYYSSKDNKNFHSTPNDKTDRFLELMIFRPADYDRYSNNKRANVVIHKYYKLNKKEKSYIHDNNDNKLFLSNSSNFTVANYEVSDQLYQTLKNHASIES